MTKYPQIVLAADPLYDDNHPKLLAHAIQNQLALNRDARTLVMVPQRDATTIRLLLSFKDIMTRQDIPLICIEEGAVPSHDDWGGDDDDEDETNKVECWWGMFKRDIP